MTEVRRAFERLTAAPKGAALALATIAAGRPVSHLSSPYNRPISRTSAARGWHRHPLRRRRILIDSFNAPLRAVPAEDPSERRDHLLGRLFGVAGVDVNPEVQEATLIQMYPKRFHPLPAERLIEADGARVLHDVENDALASAPRMRHRNLKERSADALVPHARTHDEPCKYGQPVGAPSRRARRCGQGRIRRRRGAGPHARSTERRLRRPKPRIHTWEP
jgi:hypothetical protein